MQTVEMGDTGVNPYRNGLILKGYIRESVRLVNKPESAIRSWSYGFGRGLSAHVHHTVSTRFELSTGGDQ